MNESLGDILDRALDGRPKPLRPGVATFGAKFIKALGNGHDAWGVLKAMQAYLTDEESAGIMNVLLGGDAEGEWVDGRYYVEVADVNKPTLKINAIKEIRAVTNSGLYEAKRYIEDRGLYWVFTARSAIALNDKLAASNYRLVPEMYQ